MTCDNDQKMGKDFQDLPFLIATTTKILSTRVNFLKKNLRAHQDNRHDMG